MYSDKGNGVRDKEKGANVTDGKVRCTGMSLHPCTKDPESKQVTNSGSSWASDQDIVSSHDEENLGL